MSTTGADIGGADFNIRIAKSVLRFVNDKYGAESLQMIATAANVPLESLYANSQWVSAEQMGIMFEQARLLMPNDTTFREACVYKMDEGYGPFLYVLRAAASPTALFHLMVRTMHLVSTISRWQLLDSSKTHAHVRYFSKVQETRLVCLSRQAQMTSLPALWGLPHALCEEKACLAHGDSYCEYEFRWQSKSQWTSALIGAAAGAAIAWALQEYLHLDTFWVTLPVIGACLGHIRELLLTHRGNLLVTERLSEALRKMAEEEAEGRKELLGFHQRQRDWTRLIEEQVGERTGTLQRVVEGIQRVREAREVTLRGFSHDLRNPLTVLKAEGELLEDFVDAMGPEGPAIVEDHRRAVDQMERLLAELMEVAATEQKLVRVSPEEMDVPSIVERIRRRIRALVHGREVRTSVFCTREAPEKIICDPLIFDRITDNMLTNAAKYTDRGSIIVEMDGTDEFLVFKISDTGSGIEAERIEQIFRPKGRLGDSPKQKGYGVGLSVVVQLLDQIGGQLEVMSSPGKGTTFWAYLPITIREINVTESQRPGEWSDNLINRVVKVRRSAAA